MSIFDSKETKVGVFNALGAYTMWGVAPIFFKLLSEVSAGEILVHRVIWSSILLFLIIFALKKFHLFKAVLQQKKLVLGLLVSAAFLAANWFIFIWAVNNDHLLDASLGYFINPLFSVALGMAFLGERLKGAQKVALALVIIGVAIQLYFIGSLPIVSLALAGTFGIYGLLRKKMVVDSFVGLLVESLMMLPIAIVYWIVFIDSSSANMFENSIDLNVLFILTGVVTTAPLLCFTAAAKRLPLSTVGFFQYIGPSMMFVIATYFYNEPLEPAKLATFAFIWLALAIYTFDSLKKYKRKS